MFEIESYHQLSLEVNTTNNESDKSTHEIINLSVAIVFCILMVFNLLVGTFLNSCFLITIMLNKKLRVQK